MLPSGAQWALDLVESPPQLVGAMIAMLSGVAVVNDLTEAMGLVEIRPELRAVTVDGDLVGAGWVSGGSDRKLSTLEVTSEIDKARSELAAAEALAAQLNAALAGALTEQSARQDAAEQALAALNESDTAISAMYEQLGRLGQEARAAEEEWNRLLQQRTEQEAVRTQTLDDVIQLETQLRKAQETQRVQVAQPIDRQAISAAADRARADTLFPGGGRNRQCDTFPEHRRGRVLFARRPTGLVRNDRLDQQHQFDGYRHHWGREEFGDLARARERGCGGRSPTSRHRPGVPRAADQHGQVTIGRSTTRPGRSFGRDARRGYHRANVGAARLEGARGHHRQGVRCHPNDHTARRRRPRRWSAWTARDASLGGRTGWRGAPIRRTADRDDTSTLGRVTSVRDGGAP